MAAKHVPVEDRPVYFCEKCEYKTISKGCLTNHLKRHEEKRQECYFCGKKFHRFPELVQHCRRIHTLEMKKKL